MSNKKQRINEEESINELLPDILVAAENFKAATPEKIQRCLLENYNVKATKSQVQVALDNGCRLGMIQERKRYCLNASYALNPPGKRRLCGPCVD